MSTGFERRRVGKGARFAPCPPFALRMRMRWWARTSARTCAPRCTLPTLRSLPQRVVDDLLQRRLDAGPLGWRIFQKNKEHVAGRIDHEIGAAGAVPFDLADRAGRRRHRLARIGTDAKPVAEPKAVARKIEIVAFDPGAGPDVVGGHRRKDLRLEIAPAV